jgi:hypothetical protein
LDYYFQTLERILWCKNRLLAQYEC